MSEVRPRSLSAVLASPPLLTVRIFAHLSFTLIQLLDIGEWYSKKHMTPKYSWEGSNRIGLFLPPVYTYFHTPVIHFDNIFVQLLEIGEW